MSCALDPADDHPLVGGNPDPSFAEAQQWNVTDGEYGVMCHIATMPGDIKLWQSVIAITHPDGSVHTTKIIGRGSPEMFGTPIFHTVTDVPFEAWRLRFDGAMRHFRASDLRRGPAWDGMHVPVTIELEISAGHPVWILGGHNGGEKEGLFQTVYRFHHEQAIVASGTIKIGDRTIALVGAVGHRDHSRGPRDQLKTVEHGWINATFESGWSFATIVGSSDPGGIFDVAAVFDGNAVQEGTIARWTRQESFAPTPRSFELELALPGGPRVIRATCTNGINWSGVGPTEWSIGTNRDDRENYLFSQYFAEFECDGEKGRGYVDRGRRTRDLDNA